MPELPEVETIRRQLAPRLVGRRLSDGWAFESAKFTDAREIGSATVTQVGRRGKYLVIDLEDQRQLIVHLGMTGSLRIAPDVVEPTSVPYLRARWRLEEDRTLEFRDTRRFGRIAVVRSGDYGRIATLAAMGPEPDDPQLDDGGLWRSLRTSHRHVKTSLLAQRHIAGVGNIYADEALWIAQVHPASRRITRRQADLLLDAIRVVLAEGIANGGTTLRDYVDADGSSGTNQLTLRCYGLAGTPCHRCGSTLVSRVIDARTSTYCPTCQRPR